MTREEEIKQAAYAKYCNSESICFTLMCDSFKQGVEWADKHPKSPWISVKDDLPCNHEELINPVHPWFTKEVIVVYEDGEISTAIMIKDSIGNWKFIAKVIYWMSVPNLPKE